jgi:hypothetical protein
MRAAAKAAQATRAWGKKAWRRAVLRVGRMEEEEVDEERGGCHALGARRG